DQVVPRRVLEQEPAGTGPQRLVDVFVKVEGGEHDHLGWGGGARTSRGRGGGGRTRRGRGGGAGENGGGGGRGGKGEGRGGGGGWGGQKQQSARPGRGW